MRRWWWSPRPVCCLRFDRATGEAIYPIEERPVPQTDVPGEVTSPTQPFSTIPALADQSAITPEDAFGVAFFDKRSCKRQIKAARSEGIFTPPSLQGTLMNPGYAGGSNWGSVAVDAGRQIAVTNVIQTPALVRLIPRDQLATLQQSGALKGWSIAEQKGTPYYMARRFLLSPIGLPCTKPPWGKLVAGRFDRRGGTLATATRVDQKFGPGGGAESELGSTKLRRSLNNGFWIGGHRRGR